MKQVIQFVLLISGLVSAFLFINIFPRPFIEFFPEQLANPFESETVFFLILGVDDAGEAGSDRTDAIMLVGMNNKTASFELLSIPRDLIITDPKDKTQQIKINSVYKNEGLTTLIDVIESHLKLDIEKYAIIDYSLFKYLGDLVGPVEIMVEYPMHYEDKQQDLSIHFEQGIHQMYGQELLNYIRFRDDSKGDLGRIERQKTAIKNTLTRFKDNLSLDFIEQEFRKLLNQMNTNLTTQDILYTMLNLSDFDDVIFFSYPYKIAYDGSISADENRLSTLIEDFKSFNITKEHTQKGTINVINCTDQTPRVFSIINYNILSKTGLQYFLINTKIDEAIADELENNTIMVFSSQDQERDQDLVEQFESLYSMEFDLINTNNMEILILYYKTVHSMTKNRQFYPTPLEAIVYIKKQ
ncbi:MAG: LCP family protein [Thermotogota bacterium]|nr:LCP family protein [Thermotogota bacterium]